mgnify:CR=1 FL=1
MRERWAKPLEEVLALGDMLGVDVAKKAAITPKQAVKAGILEAPEAVVEAPDQRAILAAEIDVLVARDVFGQSKQEMR